MMIALANPSFFCKAANEAYWLISWIVKTPLVCVVSV